LILMLRAAGCATSDRVRGANIIGIIAVELQSARRKFDAV
jgi:hypothetical protein